MHMLAFCQVNVLNEYDDDDDDACEMARARREKYVSRTAAEPTIFWS